MVKFTANSINRNWFATVKSYGEFAEAHKETGATEVELQDAYAQLVAITRPQEVGQEQSYTDKEEPKNETHDNGIGHGEEVAKRGRSGRGGKHANK